MEQHAVEQPYFHVLEQDATPGRKPFFIAAATAFALALFTAAAPYFLPVQVPLWLQLLIVLGTGAVYSWLAYGKLAADRHIPVYRIALFLSLALLLVLAALAFVKGSVPWFTVLAIAGAFLLPVTVAESWEAFGAIPPASKPLWHYTAGLPDAAVVYLENRPVQLRIVTEAGQQAACKTTLPAQVPLGQSFYQVLKSQQPFGEVQQTVVNNYNEPYGWVFYTRSLWGRHYLDPAASVAANNISNNASIVAERIGSLAGKTI